MDQCIKWKRKQYHSAELWNSCEKPHVKQSASWSLISQHMLLFHWSSHCNFTAAFVAWEAAVWLFFLYSFANLVSFWVISPSLWHLHPAVPQSHEKGCKYNWCLINAHTFLLPLAYSACIFHLRQYDLVCHSMGSPKNIKIIIHRHLVETGLLPVMTFHGQYKRSDGGFLS